MLNIPYVFFFSFFHTPGLVSGDMNNTTLTALVRVLRREERRVASAAQPVEPRALSTLFSALWPECDVDVASGIQGLKHCLSFTFSWNFLMIQKKIYHQLMMQHEVL